MRSLTLLACLWLSPAFGADAKVKEGEALYAKHVCSACHSNDSTPRAAPTFKGLYGKKQKLRDGKLVDVDEAYLKRSILDPQAEVSEGYLPVMPPYKNRLTPAEVDALIAYIKSLK